MNIDENAYYAGIEITETLDGTWSVNHWTINYGIVGIQTEAEAHLLVRVFDDITDRILEISKRT